MITCWFIWQDNGVKEALENGSLSKLQLSFHILDDQPATTENMIESYTLGFDYKSGISLAEITAEARDNIIGMSSFEVGDVKEQMDYLLTELNHLLLSSNATRRVNRFSLPGKWYFRIQIGLQLLTSLLQIRSECFLAWNTFLLTTISQLAFIQVAINC